MKQMEYVYSLVHDGQIFYIGRTKDICSRYKTHLSCVGTTETVKRIKQILDSGSIPTIRIINYLPWLEAARLEFTLIRSISSAGQKLTNSQWTWEYPRDYLPDNIPQSPTKKDMITVAKYHQMVFTHQWGQRNKIYDFHYPEEPFKNYESEEI